MSAADVLASLGVPADVAAEHLRLVQNPLNVDGSPKLRRACPICRGIGKQAGTQGQSRFPVRMRCVCCAGRGSIETPYSAWRARTEAA